MFLSLITFKGSFTSFRMTEKESFRSEPALNEAEGMTLTNQYEPKAHQPLADKNLKNLIN